VNTRRIGSLDVSVIGIGCNNFGVAVDAAGTAGVVGAALDAGVTYFDTAAAYGEGRSEELLGAALTGRRDEAVIATKWGHPSSLAGGERGGDPAVVRASLEASLRRLGVETVDHFQLHRPDPDTPIAETLGALDELRAEGKLRETGATVFTAAEIDDAASTAARTGRRPLASIQNHYSLLTRSPERDGVLDACRRHGLAFIPFFPLEAGVLTGKYRTGEPLPAGSRMERWGERRAGFIDDDRLAAVSRLTAYAEARGHTVLELAISWLTSNPLVATVITGCTSPAQVAANAAGGDWALTAAERAEVAALLDGSPP
jgi:aryl-alcohol dehydrogenase-like predicted oxidoreductase